MSRLKVMGMIALAAMLLAVAAAQQTRRTETGTVTAAEFEWDFANNKFLATGDVVVNIAGRHQAQLRAPQVSLDMNDTMNRIVRAVASGPVRLELLTAPDANGLRRKIIATCGGRATYEAGSDTVTMSGGAQADVTTLPEGKVEAAHLKGDSITVNLRDSKMSVKQATISVTTEINEGQGE